MKALNIYIIHSLPGRLRLRLSKSPRNIDDFMQNVKKREGIDFIDFNPVTGSILATYKPSFVSTIEIIVRIGIILSLDHDGDEVSLIHQEKGRALTSIDYYAMGSLFAGGISRIISPNTYVTRVLAYNAGFSTLFAVLGHAWAEVRRNGLYDPEAISVIYLINSLIKGNFLLAGAVTWLATFGRHITTPATQVCTVEAGETKTTDKQEYIEVVIKPVLANAFENNPVKIVVEGLGHVTGLSSNKNQYHLMEQIQQMSRIHGNVLEGIGNKPGPVYMKLNKNKMKG